MSASDLLPVLVIGAGPAGISTAIWLHNFDVPFHWVDAAGAVGGTLRRIHNEISNFPGGPFEDGQALCASLNGHLSTLDLAPKRHKIVSLRLNDHFDHPVAVDDEKVEHQAHRIILATGTSYRRLGIPGETEGMGDFVSQSAAGDAPRFAGRSVAVVGGGDAAFENALILADHDCQVTILARNHNFHARTSFVEAVQHHRSIHIPPRPSVVTRIEPAQGGCRLFIDQQGHQSILEVAAVFIRIGVDPRVPGGCQSLQKDGRGFIVVDGRGRTSHSDIFAVGDVTITPLRSAITAAGSGAHAAKACAEDLGFF